MREGQEVTDALKYLQWVNNTTIDGPRRAAVPAHALSSGADRNRLTRSASVSVANNLR
jgi:hypothetical protein